MKIAQTCNMQTMINLAVVHLRNKEGQHRVLSSHRSPTAVDLPNVREKKSFTIPVPYTLSISNYQRELRED